MQLIIIKLHTVTFVLQKVSISSSLSSSFPEKFYANVNSEPCLLSETPMSKLEKRLRKKSHFEDSLSQY